MKGNYCTYKREGKFFIGVYCLNGQVSECSKKRTERGQAVKDAAEARKSELQKEEKPKPIKKNAKKPHTRKTAKTAPVSSSAS